MPPFLLVFCHLLFCLRLTNIAAQHNWYGQIMHKMYSRFGRDVAMIWPRYGRDMAKIWQNNDKAIAKIWSWWCPSEVGQNVSMEELGQNVAAKKYFRGECRTKCGWDKMSSNPYQTYHCFHNCWYHLVVELDTCSCLWRCFLNIGEKAKYISGKQIGTSGRWMGWWRQIGEKASNKLEQYRRSCIHT